LFDLRLLKRVDWALFAAVLALSLYGLVMVYSATRAPEAAGITPLSQFAEKQIMWLIIGLGAFFITLVWEYEAVARWHIPAYVVVMLLLLFVLKIGKSPTGAQSWIGLGGFRLQPSEFAKICVILSLAVFLSRRAEAITRVPLVLRSLIIAGAPVLLVLLQPDFGTALVTIAIWFGVLYLSGAKRLHLIAVFATGLLLFTCMWNVDKLPLDRMRPAVLGKVLAHARLKDYQKKRLTIFLNPRSDPLGSGYHVIQSRLAIGSGEVVGRGLFHGTQSRLHFIPERHTDFIFSVVGEELGLAGAAAMLSLYFFLFWRGLRIATRARDLLGTLLAAGAASMLIFHTIVNVGMSVNIMPITGIPLPFVSYGGSNMLASFVAFGLLQNVHMRRDKIIF
jgi:rod shape determining protein RodA